MSTTADFEFYAELLRRQHAIEGTIAGYKAKIVDSERELEECLEMVQQWRHDHSILTFPNEITSEIFLHCLPVYSDDCFADTSRSTSDPLRAPMLLLHVCREWRSIAVSTPALWERLHLDLWNLPDVFFEADNLEQFLVNWLARARARPLSLFLEPEDDGNQGSHCTILNRLSSRTQVLKLNYVSYWIQHLEGNTPDFPLLRNLSLASPHEYVGNEDLIGPQGYPIQMFSVASQLRELELDSVAPSLFVIPWEVLAVFTGRYLRHDDCVDVLRQASSLVECTLEETYPDSFSTGTPVVSHPHLKSLKVLRDCTIFRWLTLPALEKLEVDLDGIDEEDLLQFIIRSASSLLKLSSGNLPLESLSTMAALTDLSLVNLSRSNEYLDEFFRHFDRTNHPRFLPQLQVLEFTGRLPFVNTILVDALCSRSAPTQDGRARLRSFRQIWADGTPLQFNFEQGVGLALAELAGKGMDIYIGPKREI